MNIPFSARSETLQIELLGHEDLLLYVGKVSFQDSCSEVTFVK